jgi:hypothetical protein
MDNSVIRESIFSSNPLLNSISVDALDTHPCYIKSA